MKLATMLLTLVSCLFFILLMNNEVSKKNLKLKLK